MLTLSLILKWLRLSNWAVETSNRMWETSTKTRSIPPSISAAINNHSRFRLILVLTSFGLPRDSVKTALLVQRNLTKGTQPRSGSITMSMNCTTAQVTSLASMPTIKSASLPSTVPQTSVFTPLECRRIFQILKQVALWASAQRKWEM